MSFLLLSQLSTPFSLLGKSGAPVAVQSADRPHLELSAADIGQARPWTFWYWMYGAVTPEGITADLEAMADVGLAGCYLMPIKGVDQKPGFGGTARQGSAEFWRMVDWACHEAYRLGLRLGLHVCDGFALAGGPWIKEAESMQRLIMTAPDDTTGMTVAYYRLPSAYLHGAPVTDGLDDACRGYHLLTGGSVRVEGSGELGTDSEGRGGVSLRGADSAGWFEYRYPRPVKVSSLTVSQQGTQLQVYRLRIQVSDDSVHYRDLVQMEPPRHGWQNYDQPMTFSLPTTEAPCWRFVWDPIGTEPGSEDLDCAKWKPVLKVRSLTLRRQPVVDQWEGKAGRAWRISSSARDHATTDEYIPLSLCLPLGPDLPAEGTSEGRRAPSRRSGSRPDAVGPTTMVRFASVSTGHTNATGGDARGLECDKFTPEVVQKQFDHWVGEAFRRCDEATVRRVLRFLHVDSWECGCQNWSPRFADEFARRRGYDLMPWLPLMVGLPMEDCATSERVLRDVRLTIDELVQDSFYGTLRHAADSLGLTFSAEAISPTMVADGMEHYRQADLPMGEFWLDSPTHDKPNDMLDAISGGHVYGKRIIQAEGFTEVRGVWDADPARLKPLLDRQLALGINRLFFHVYAHNPWPERRPGMTLDGIGLFFQRGQTWWREGRALVDYATRCSALLQRGWPVTDVAVLTGGEMPRRAIMPNQLADCLPGLVGKGRVAREAERRTGRTLPLRTVPVGVTSRADMVDPLEWLDPLHGYAYDSYNLDALRRLTTVRQPGTGQTSPFAYRLLVVPGARPMDPDGQSIPDSLLAALPCPVVRTPVTAPDLSAWGIAPDAVVPDSVAWCHRSVADTAEIYFISNQAAAARTLTVGLRDHRGRRPMVYDAVTDLYSAPIADSIDPDGRLHVTFKVEGYGSRFVLLEATAPALPVDGPERTTPLSRVRPWDVTFESNGVHLVTDTLFDWSSHPADSVRYYSGRATYSTKFCLPSGQSSPVNRVKLRMGQVDNVATVNVNGRDCGVAWTRPYEVDITDALPRRRDGRLDQRAEVTLRVEVVNTWSNALDGMDRGTPPFADIWTNATYRHSGTPLLPSGLHGPIEIVLQ